MTSQDLIQSIAKKTDSRIVLLVLDGVGGLPVNGKTALEAAKTPNLDAIARNGILGLTDPIFPGITPGSGPGHLSLFGYDPMVYQIGRGIMEAFGVGMEVTDQDIATRANFATLEDGKIMDRRAGRPPTAKNRELVATLSQKIKQIDDVEVRLASGEEHRFVAIFRGDGLDDRIEDADPGKEGLPAKAPIAKVPEAQRTADIVAKFIARVNEVLKDDAPTNSCLVRGFARDPKLPSMTDLFQLNPACVAVYPMYRGLARLVGMDIIPTEITFSIRDQFRAVKENWDKYDFFFVHIKKTDSYGEDGNFDNRVHVLEDVDQALPELLALQPDVLAVGGDHSTPSPLKAHSWHPVPFMLSGKWVRTDDTSAFGETQCIHGGLGRFPAMYAMPQMLGHALKMDKYGA